MESLQLKLHQIAEQLPPQQLETVLDFAEFLAFKAKNGSQRPAQNHGASKRLELPVVKGVIFHGDPLLRREDLYNDSGR